MNTHQSNIPQPKNKAAANEPSSKQVGEAAPLSFEDNRPESIQFKHLQKIADNSPVVHQQGVYQKMADGASPHASIKTNDVVQRVVQVVGVTQTVDQVDAHFTGTANALTPARTAILENWSNSPTIHNFRPSQGRTGWDKIPLALARAEASPAAPPALFRAANLQFITQAGGGRLATLYFTGGGQTGRLRQQHGSGPLAEIDPVAKTRISFANRADRTTFVNALRVSRDTGAVFADPVPGTHNAPVAGQELLEYYMAGGGIAGGWHPSEGLVQATPPGLNTDVAITGVYNDIIGADPDEGCCCGCFITTACMMAKGLADNCEELTILRDYRDHYLLKRKHGEELFRFYYTYSPSIVHGINAEPGTMLVYEGLYAVIQKCVSCIRRRELEEAYEIYVKMVLQLKDRYAPYLVIPDYLMAILREKSG